MNVSLYQAAAALDANSRWQEIISENLASSSVPGFKKQDLAMAATQAGLMPSGNLGSPQFFSIPKASSATSFQAGDIQYTGNKSDVAIEGKGFFQVTLPDGTSAVTRDGEFQVNAKGNLVTKEGYTVQGKSGPIQLDTHNPNPISISTTGEVSQGSSVKDQLALTDFGKPDQLKKLSGSYFLSGGLSSLPQAATGTLRQGYLEGSNTSSVREMANMITAMRTFEANQHVIQIQDDRMSKAITELGTPN